jgi:thiol:disulfide interchange protein DsbC
MQHAIAAAAPADETETIRAALARSLQGHTIASVRPTPIKGIYEVALTPPQILYTDAQGKYVLTGAMVDLARQVNLTEQRMADLNHVDFSKLPLEQSIKTVKGSGARKLAIFSDPDCPYCKRLEKETLSHIDNVTIYTFLYPLDQHADASRKAGAIWCAPDRARAWDDWMLRGKLPSGAGSCASPLEANLALASRLGVRATPTIVTEKGELVMGAVPPATLEAKMTK